MIIGLVGISGVGKTYLKNKVVENNNEYTSLIAVTTREQRINEINGEDKYFLTNEEFINFQNDIDIITDMYGAKYGFWKKDLCKEEIQIVELYYKDIPKMTKYNIKTIFITTSCYKKNFLVLLDRYGMTKKLFKRLIIDIYIKAYLLVHKKSFDYVVKNDYSEKSIKEIRDVISAMIMKENNKI